MFISNSHIFFSKSKSNNNSKKTKLLLVYENLRAPKAGLPRVNFFCPAQGAWCVLPLVFRCFSHFCLPWVKEGRSWSCARKVPSSGKPCSNRIRKILISNLSQAEGSRNLTMSSLIAVSKRLTQGLHLLGNCQSEILFESPAVGSMLTSMNHGS